MKWLIILLLVFAGGITSCTGNDSKNEKQEESQQTYTCPMHPDVRSDDPEGECPICGMDLVPLEDAPESSSDHEGRHEKEEESSSQQLRVSPQRQQLIGVKTDEVKKRALEKRIFAPGRVAFDPELYTVQSEYLEALRQWERVKDSPLEEVKRNTREMIESARIRLRVLGLSEEQIAKIRPGAQQPLDLILSNKEEKSLIYAEVFESDLSLIREGLKAKVTSSSQRGKEMEAEVVGVDQVIDPDNRTGKVRLKLAKPQSGLRSESFVRVQILVPMGEHLAAPKSTLLDTGKQAYVFVQKEKGVFQPTPVQVAFETEDSVAFLGGVNAGEHVVVESTFMLDSESRLRGLLGDMHDH